jgi:hypothetical protein
MNEWQVNVSVGGHSAIGFDRAKVMWSMWCMPRCFNEEPQEDYVKLLPIAAVIAAFALTPVAFAQTAAPAPANKVDCEKAKMKWDTKGGKDGKGACVAAPAAAKDAVKK